MQATSAWVDSDSCSRSPSPMPSTVKRSRGREPEAPDLPFLPVFTQLMERHDVSRGMALVYGAIAAFHACGHAPTGKQLAFAVAMDEHHVQRCVYALQGANLVRVTLVRARRRRLELLGPTLPAT